MKKMLTASIILFCAVIVFFSLFGEKLYYSTRPAITLCRASDGIIDGDGNICVTIPKSCVFEEKYVYGISTYPGFSMTIYSVVRQEVEAEPNPDDESTVIVKSGVRQGQMLVRSASKKLSDGAQVVIK